MRLVQGYGSSIRSKEDYAVTYVLDSGFQNFVNRNRNILPDWFTQAIQPSLLEAPFGHAVFVNISKVLTTSKENHNEVINNHYNPSIISEQTVAKTKELVWCGRNSDVLNSLKECKKFCYSNL